jgi:tetratricopeptide (TPR) repeat protein
VSFKNKRASSTRIAAAVVGALAAGGCTNTPDSSDEVPAIRRTGVRAAPSTQQLAETAYLRGLELSLAHKHRAAIKQFYEAVEFDPLRADAHYRAGLSYYALDEYEAERTEYRKAVAINPRVAQTWRALGESCQAIDDLHGARDAFRAAVRLEPKALTLFNLALIETDLGNATQARSLYERCLELSPVDADAGLRQEAEIRLRSLTTDEQDG